VVEDVRHALMEGLGSVPAMGAVLAGQGRSCRSSSWTATARNSGKWVPICGTWCSAMSARWPAV